MSDKLISQYIEDQFPSFYKEEGPLFIQFVKAYYEWMEQEKNVQWHISNALNDFDIDNTVDDFINHFKQQYLPSITFATDTDRRSLLKRSRDFLTTKGTPENIELLMKLVYNQDASVFRPNDKVLRPSDGVWYEPKYLELSPSSKTQSFIGKNIIGSRSGATALAERVSRKTINGVVFDVLYITQVKGNFIYKEVITSDGLLDGCPVMIGSMTNIDVTSGGKDFSVGDVVEVQSTLTGKSGLARVAKIGRATGRVTFDLLNGGYGFTNNATVYVSERVVNLTDKTPDPTANASYQDFTLLEEVIQPMQTVEALFLSGAIAINSHIIGYAANNAQVANGYVVGVPSSFSANSQTVKVIVYGGSFTQAANVTATYTVNSTPVTVTGIVDVVSNTSATGTMVGLSNPLIQTINVAGLGNEITANSTVRGYRLGNTTSNTAVVATGVVKSVVSGLAANNETVEVLVYTGSFNAANLIATPSNVAIGSVGAIVNTYSTDISVGSLLPAIGLADIRGSFTSNTPYAYVRGVLSNTYANVSSVSTGQGASFDIGLLTNTEKVFINTDRLAANNVYNQPYMAVKLINDGFVDDIVVANPTANATHLFQSGGGTLYTEGDIEPVVFTGGTPTTNASATIIVANGVLYSVTVSSDAARGTNYTNNQLLVFSGNTKTVEASLRVARNSATITSGNTQGLYVGLAVTGEHIPSNTFISSIDNLSSTLTLSNAPSSNVEGIVLSFPASGYITTNTSGAISSITITSQGTHYSTAPTITIKDGTTGNAANLVASIANGVIVDVRVDTIGQGYDVGAVTAAATTSGVTANLQVLIDSGYGFPKDPSADLDTILNNALTSGEYTIGTIAGITNINLGAGYNQDPFVLVVEPVTVGFNRRNIYIGHDNPLNNFVVGENISQSFSNSVPLITYANKGIVDFELQELVVQGTASGVITALEELPGNTGVMYIGSVSGTFAANSTPIIGQTTGATANVSVATTTTVPSVSKGVIVATSNGYIEVERRSFNLSFQPNVAIVGGTSGATANVLSVGIVANSKPIGFNASIDAQAGTIEGFIQQVDVIDAGFAYKDLEPIELKQANNDYIASGYVRLANQGYGEGYFLSERGFLNDSWNYIHDNDYWQEYSYEVRTGISLTRYGDVLKKACHVAGTKLFGMIEKIIEIPETIVPQGYLSTGDTTLFLANGSGSGIINSELLSSNGTVVGYANGSITSEFYSNGYVEVAANSIVHLPNTASSTTTGRVYVSHYTGSSANTTFFNLYNSAGSLLPSAFDNANGQWLPSSTTAEVVTNTNIVYTNTANLVAGDIVYQVPSTLIAALENSSNGYVQTSRTSVASYRNGAGRLVIAGVNTLRPNYDSNNAYIGVLLEDSGTNVLTYSDQFGMWSNSGVSVTNNDIEDVTTTPTVISQLADKIKATATSGAHELTLSYGSVTSGKQYTFSCFFKKAEYSFAALMINSARFGTNQQAVIDLDTGATNVTNGAPLVTVEPYIDGWYRLAITATATSSGTGTAYVRLATSLSTTSFLGTLNYGVYAFGAQFEEGKLTSYIPSQGSAGVRAADVFTLTASGWSGVGSAVGKVVAVANDYIVVNPFTRIEFVYGSNNAPLPVGNYAIQSNTSTELARGEIVFSNNTTMIVSSDVTPFTKYFGPVKVANAAVLTYISNSTSNASSITVGMTVTQVTGSNTVQGVVTSKNTSAIVVTNANGTFVPSTNNTVGRLVGSTANASANVFVSVANTINVPISSTTRLASFSANGRSIVGQNASSVAISNTVHNSNAQLHTVIVPVSYAINKLDVTEFKGVALGAVITGNNSGTSATIIKIER